MMLRLIALIALTSGAPTGSPELWRYNGHTAIRDETSDKFELVVQRGTAIYDAPVESIIRRVEGRTGAVLAINRTWGRPEPRPDVVFGWKGEFVLYDSLLATFVRSPDVFNHRQPTSAATNPGQALQAESVSILAIPGGGRYTKDRTVPTRVSLLQIYPAPVVGPRSSGEPFTFSLVDLDAMSAAAIRVDQAADEVAMKGNLLVTIWQGEIAGYSRDGKRVWRQDAVPGERLKPTSDFLRWRESMSLSDGNMLVTTVCPQSSEDTLVILRSTTTGEILWKKQVAGRKPLLGEATASYAIFLGSHAYEVEANGMTIPQYHHHWWAWNAAGAEVASGGQPEWKAEYADRPDGDPTEIGIATDPGTSSILIGCAMESTLIRKGDIRKVANLPGEPVLLDRDMVVCKTKAGMVGVELTTK